MGWKNVKEHYQIGHIVQVTDAGICIGSPYIHDLIVVSMEGEITKPYPQERYWSVNEDLARYCREMQADPEKLKELVTQPDNFENFVPIFTYDSDTFAIVEHSCDEPGWPNVTHNGRVMYENTFSTDRAKVVKWAIKSAKAAIEMARDRQKHLTADLNDAKLRMTQAERGLAAIEQEAG